MTHFQVSRPTLREAVRVLESDRLVEVRRGSRTGAKVRVPGPETEGNPQQLVASPVKFDDNPTDLVRAPQFAEHTDEVLRELGADDDHLIDLKIAGAIT